MYNFSLHFGRLMLIWHLLKPSTVGQTILNTLEPQPFFGFKLKPCNLFFLLLKSFSFVSQPRHPMTSPGQITVFVMASASLAEIVPPGKPSCNADVAAARKRLAGGAAGSPGARDGRGNGNPRCRGGNNRIIHELF